MPPPPPAVSEFKLSDAVAHLNSLTAGSYQLWAFYTATVLGSLALALSHPLTPTSSALFLVGFWAFALGELALLRKAMTFINDIRRAIADRLGRADDGTLDAYRPALLAITHDWNPIAVAVTVQILGDLCVTALMVANGSGSIAVR